MFTILLHSSKTMRPPSHHGNYQAPQLLEKATQLGDYLKTLSPSQIQKSMQLSKPMAEKTHQLLADWSVDPSHQSPAIDTFLGDIYSGLQVETFDGEDRAYADSCLYILSGLYGLLRPLDCIQAYRVEMAYRFPKAPYDSLYRYWGDTIARSLPANRTIINVSSVEYTKAIFPHLDQATVITPKFMTRDDKGDPKFVTVHAKIARGAFAHWLIKHRIESIDRLADFDELGYVYYTALSTDHEPVYVCDTFGGIGMSVRLKKS